jgi:predicted SAM-dependent methyltransferase
MTTLSVLNVCGGNIEPLRDMVNEKKGYAFRTLNVDKCYFFETTPEAVEEYYRTTPGVFDNRNFYLNHDIFNFLERTNIKFDAVAIYRYLEHVSFTQILYFIYLISRVVKKDGIVDIIVPDYTKLAEMILNESIDDKKYEANNIVLTTELLNEPSNPHASIWTGPRLKYYWELEGRFKGEQLFTSYKFDDRNIYLRAQMTRL